MSDISKQAEALSPNQRILFELLMEEKRQQKRHSHNHPIPRRQQSDALPLSLVQQRLWLFNQLEPDSGAYNIYLVLRLRGSLDLAALEHSLNAIIGRHESLRTTFTLRDGAPIQVIAPARGAPVGADALPMIDLRALPEAEREAAARQLAATEVQRPFDLARGPLFRPRLLRLETTRHLLILTMHHVIADGWSIAVLNQELTTLYAAAVAGRPATLPELPIQYADYAIWQRQWLRGEVLQAQLAYWKEQLAGLPTLQLPTDHPHPPSPSFRGATYEFTLEPALNAKLAALSRRTGTTLFMTLLAAFQLLLARYTGQDDIVVGTTIANRTQVEVEPLIGCFFNTLVLRTRLDTRHPFLELLARVREVALGAYAYPALPFEQLVEALQPARDPGRQPLFQVLFELHTMPPTDSALAELEVEPLGAEHGTAKFDLSLVLTKRAAGLAGTLVYATDLFIPPTIERLAGHFHTLLEGIVADPERACATLPLLTAAEWHELVIARNATAQPYSSDAAYSQLFAAQVARSPDALAASCATAHLTYQELARRAELLARFLQQRGVGPGARVGLCLDRSFAMLVGLLGIFQAGAAFVPLDPAFPPERIAFILNDAQVKLLLVATNRQDKGTRTHGDKEIRDLLVSLSPCLNSVVDLVADWPAIARTSTQPPAAIVNRKSKIVNANDLAYLIYTSGSTGTPKGVLIPHRGLLNYLHWCCEAYTLRAGRGAPVHAAIAADAIFPSLFAPLLLGACVVLIPEPQPLETLAATLRESGHLSMLKITPSQLKVLNQLLPPSVPRDSVRTLVVGAEALRGEVLQFWQAHAPATMLLNEYGPTETVVGCSIYRVIASIRGAVPIGLPIANTQFYVLDAQLQPVPVGVVGELYIGGEGMAWGYHNRPDLTAERFIPNPFAGDTETRRHGDKEIGDAVARQSAICNLQSAIGTRLYKTGDRVRYLADRAGNMVFLGRADDQVKIRGYRVEPGEVEALLRSHAAVREVIVLAREDRLGEKCLVAYVVEGSGVRGQGSGSEDKQTRRQGDKETDDRRGTIYRAHTSLVNDLREFLKARLPDYMLPSAFVLLDAMPLAPHGKVDRAALPAPEQGRPALDEPFTAPRTATEELLAGIWSQLLRIETIGIHDNFFELGGHSLLATQLVSRVRESFQVDLSLRSLFESPTVAGLAAQIEATRRDMSGPPAPGIRRTERDGALPLSFAQQRLWFLDQLEPGSPTYIVPAAVRLTGPLQRAALERSFTIIAQRHETLRTTFALVNEQPVQVIAQALDVSLPLLDLLALPTAAREATARRLARDEAQRLFDLARGPLLRLTLLRLDCEEHVLLAAMHHIISDGWSIGVLIRELAALYEAQVASAGGVGKGASGHRDADGHVGPSLPELPIQYADFAVWQRTWLRGDVLESQLAYWRSRLAGIPAVLDLPTDRPRPAIQSFRGATQTFTLPTELSRALQALSQRSGVTLFMTMLAAWTTLLARYTGQTDIVVGTSIAGRTRAELERLIGFFVNTLVLRTDLSGDPSFRVLLGRVREEALGAYAHQDLPFEQLVEALQPVRELSYTPLFQVLFDLQNAPLEPLNLPQLTLRPLEFDKGTAKFDLSATLEETEDGLAGTLEYNIDLFDTTTIMRAARHFRALLEGVLAHAGRPLAQVPLLTTAEQQQLLVEWNDAAGIRDQGSGVRGQDRRTSRQGDKETSRSKRRRSRGQRSGVSSDPSDSWCLQQLFEAQVARTPDAIAVVFDFRDKQTSRQADKQTTGRTTNDDSVFSHPEGTRRSAFSVFQMTYQELDRRANQLAHHLGGLGVGPEVLVALLDERGPQFLIAILAVFKAGGAYLPLDPTYPAERIAFMLEDSQARVLLQDTETRGQGAKELTNLLVSLSPDLLVSRTVVDLRADWPQIAQQPDTPPISRAAADNLAYTIYTSGSTGAPKGVLIEQRGMLNHLWVKVDLLGLHPGSIVAQTASHGFDISIWQFLAPLLAGGQVVIYENDVVLDQSRFLHAIQRDRVNVVETVPTLLTALLEAVAELRAHGESVALPALTHMISNAETLSVPLCRAWLAHFPQVPIINTYGATECSDDTTHYVMRTPPPANAHRVPVGTPIPGFKIYVLDAQLRPMPIGCTGQIAMAGVGVGQGYLGDASKTASAFVPNPFTDFGLPILDFGLGAPDDPIQNPKSKMGRGSTSLATWAAGPRRACWSSWAASMGR